jgi:hypothetical protein
VVGTGVLSWGEVGAAMLESQVHFFSNLIHRESPSDPVVVMILTQI